jgi:putative membrane protein
VLEKFDLFIRHLIQLGGTHPSLSPAPGVVYLSLFSFLLAGLATLAAGVRFIRVRRHINRGEAEFSIVPDVLVVVSVVVVILLALLLSIPTLLAQQHTGN